MKNMSPIIPVSTGECQVKSWKNLLKSAITDPYQLLDRVGVSPDTLPFKLTKENAFPVRVPQPFVDKMTYGDPTDPLLLQVLSQQAENIETAGFGPDPLAESNSDTPGLLHKYHGRVLLILSAACAVNCRYCFRRHFPYQDKTASGAQLRASLDYISKNKTITEVILSGGDPLILGDDAIASLISEIAAMPQVKRLRIHTRLPVVIPQRITSRLAELLANTRLDVTMVLHINHANEIDKRLSRAIKTLADAEVTLLNQSVILKGVNDNAASLIDLSESLFAARILPYYIHLLDKVAGAAHFDVPLSQARKLVETMRLRLPGYLVPRLALEEAGKGSKTIIA